MFKINSNFNRLLVTRREALPQKIVPRQARFRVFMSDSKLGSPDFEFWICIARDELVEILQMCLVAVGVIRSM